MDFSHLTDDGLRDHLLACSDWLLTHDDAGVRESYRAGREVLRDRIEHRAAPRVSRGRGLPPHQLVAPTSVLRTKLLVTRLPTCAAESTVRSHLRAGGTAVCGESRLQLGDNDVVCTADGCRIEAGTTVELRGMGPLRRMFDDALRVVSSTSPGELVRDLDDVTPALVVQMRVVASVGDFGSFDPTRCLTLASSMTPPVRPAVVAAVVLMLAADS